MFLNKDGLVLTLEEHGAFLNYSAAARYVKFLSVADAYAQMSKYPGTKVGALILSPARDVRASGWNGAPRGSDADVDSRLINRDTRLAWAVHAEANAIANAARAGTPVNGCVMVVTHTPCMSCAKLIVQAGISMVVTRKPDEEFALKWREDLDNTRQLFAECGVTLVELADYGDPV